MGNQLSVSFSICVHLIKGEWKVENEFTQTLDTHNYEQAYSLIASLQPALAQLFDDVLILSEDGRIFPVFFFTTSLYIFIAGKGYQ